jgi:hypothetical protein
MRRCWFFSLLCLAGSRLLLAQPPAGATAAFDSYVLAVESRLTSQHLSVNGFLAEGMPLRPGSVSIDRLSSHHDSELPGALLHHWRGTAFATAAHIADFEHLLKDFSSYPQTFAPQVLRTRTANNHLGGAEVSMRVRQKHVISVVLESTYDVTFGRLDARHGFSTSRSTRISEIDSPGTPAERALTPSEEHGFLWRLNTYWSYEERDGGLYLQIETVSLTRSIPLGLGWAIRPYVVSIPRESLEFTLRAATTALQKQERNIHE